MTSKYDFTHLFLNNGASAPCSCLTNTDAEQLKPNGNLLNRYKFVLSVNVVKSRLFVEHHLVIRIFEI